MKRKTLLALALCCFTGLVFSQEPMLLSPDSITNCSLIRSGTFKSQDYSADDYTMTVSGDVITEYVQHNKYYLKSKIEFTGPCTYKSRVIEVTIPAYEVKPGAYAVTEILQTQGRYIKIRSQMGEAGATVVLEKIK